MKILAILLTFFAHTAFAEDVTYDPATGVVHIPQIRVIGDDSGTTYTVNMTNSLDGSFRLDDINENTSIIRLNQRVVLNIAPTRLGGDYPHVSFINVIYNENWNLGTSVAWPEDSAAVVAELNTTFDEMDVANGLELKASLGAEFEFYNNFGELSTGTSIVITNTGVVLIDDVDIYMDDRVGMDSYFSTVDMQN